MDRLAGVDAAALEAGYRALLRSHDRAFVTAIDSHGFFVAMPATLGEHHRSVLRGRSGLELVGPDQRTLVLDAWDRVRSTGAAELRIRLLRGGDASLHLFDLRARHDLVVAVLVPDDTTDIGVFHNGEEVTPRLCTQRKNQDAIFVDVDDATTRILGWQRHEIVGHGSLEFVHPDDQDRAVESWVDMLSSPGVQRRARLRYRHANGSWIWLELTNHNLFDDPQHRCVVTEMLDVSDEMAAHEEVRRREQLLRRVAETVPLGLLHLDPSRDILYANDRLYEILAVPKADASTTVAILVKRLPPADRASLTCALDGLLIDGTDRDLEVAVRTRRRGDERRCLLRLRALTDTDGGVGGAIVCVEDVTERANARAELERRATYDPLTGCMNRASVLQHLEAQLETAVEIGVIFIDLDGFKGVNDSHGHATGDTVLIQVARRIEHTIRESETLGRLGGDEFLVVCSDADSAAVEHLASRITNALAAPLDLPGGLISLRASIGIATTHGNHTSSETLVADADTAMYVAKRNADGRPITHDASEHSLPTP